MFFEKNLKISFFGEIFSYRYACFGAGGQFSASLLAISAAAATVSSAPVSTW